MTQLVTRATPSRHRLRLAGAAVVASTALGLAACGGSSSTNSPAATPSTAAPTGPVVTINNFAFSPKALTVAVGTTVTWVNHDVAVHDVKFAGGGIPLSPLLMSDSSKDSWSHTFTKAGTYSYICGIHPTMTGTVTVGS